MIENITMCNNLYYIQKCHVQTYKKCYLANYQKLRINQQCTSKYIIDNEENITKCIKPLLNYAKHTILKMFTQSKMHISHTSMMIIYNLIINSTKQIRN